MAKKTMTDADIISTTANYKNEAKMARFDRIQQNRINFDVYHMRQDFSYKVKGQSREFLPKMAMAVEQNSNFIQQGLVDIGDWFSVDAEDGINPDQMRFKPSEIQRILQRHLEKNNIIVKIADAVKLGMIGSLMIAKVHGKYVPKPRYKTEEKIVGDKHVKRLIKIEDKAWELKIDLVRQEDFYPDPTGRGLYVMEDIYIDYYELEEMAQRGLYDLAMVQTLRGTYTNEGYDREWFRNKEAGQNPSQRQYRHRVKLTECWGNIINAEGELVHENVVWTIANDRLVIQKPTENKFWHGENPYVVAPILSVPHGVWGKALMDAPTMLNRAINEMMNLIIDGGMMSVHGVKQIREHWLEDPTQVDQGIDPGATLRVNASCPPGAQVLERVDTSSIPSDGITVLNLINQEFFTSALTNDLRMGVAPFRSVKATEVVEASQTITGMFAGMAKQIESQFIGPLLAKSWKTIAQHTQDLNPETLKSIIGSRRAESLMGMGNEDLFADTVQGCVFRVFGISATLAKQKEFTKIQGLLQTIVSSPILMEEFTKKYDFSKLLEEIMKSLDIRPYKLEADRNDGGDLSASGQQSQQTPQGMADSQSQIPQAGAAGNQGDLSGIPHSDFPGSRATSTSFVPNLGG